MQLALLIFGIFLVVLIVSIYVNHKNNRKKQGSFSRKALQQMMIEEGGNLRVLYYFTAKGHSMKRFKRFLELDIESRDMARNGHVRSTEEHQAYWKEWDQLNRGLLEYINLFTE